MITLTLRELMVQKGIKPRVFELVKRGIGYNSARTYLSGNAKSIKFADLYTLCITFRCTPKELMRVEFPDPTLFENHPLFEWSHPFVFFPLDDLQELTPSQMAKMKAAMEQIKNEGK